MGQGLMSDNVQMTGALLCSQGGGDALLCSQYVMHTTEPNTINELRQLVNNSIQLAIVYCFTMVSLSTNNAKLEMKSLKYDEK